MRSFLLALAVVALVVAEDVTSYAGQIVVRATVSSQEQINKLAELQYDVWSNDGVIIVGANDIMIPEKDVEILRQLGITYVVNVPSVQALIDQERAQHAAAKGNASLLGFYETYQTYDVIAEYVSSLATKFSHLATYVPSIGKTVQGKDIAAISFTGPTNASAAEKKQIFFIGGQHAREWIAPVTVVYIIEQLLTNYGVDPVVTAILDKVRFVVVYQVNLDGYQFSWTTTRLWRKNRQLPPQGSSYYGVDLNRNWNDHWGGQGSSHVPSSDTYCGTGPFSEPESTAVSEYISKSGPYDAFIDFHSYSQLVLRPEGWTTTPPPNEAVSKAVADEIRDEIFAVNRVQYTSTPSWNLYFTTGSSTDWTYSQADIPLSYCIELRDTGTYGFVLPANQIIPTGQENYAAAKFLGAFVAESTK